MSVSFSRIGKSFSMEGTAIPASLYALFSSSGVFASMSRDARMLVRVVEYCLAARTMQVGKGEL